MYPTYHRKDTFFERLVFWSKRFEEQPGIPAGHGGGVHRHLAPGFCVVIEQHAILGDDFGSFGPGPAGTLPDLDPVRLGLKDAVRLVDGLSAEKGVFLVVYAIARSSPQAPAVLFYIIGTLKVGKEEDQVGRGRRHHIRLLALKRFEHPFFWQQTDVSFS
jgi:hypothetical protein